MADNIQEIITKVLEDADKNHNEYRKVMEGFMIEKAKVLQALHAIRLPGVEVPEINRNSLRYTTLIKVSDIRMFPVLQKILGCKFEHWSKTPLGDGRKNMIRVGMVIKDNEKLRYELEFTYDRKLTKNDKCKVVTKSSTHTTVVCKRD